MTLDHDPVEDDGLLPGEASPVPMSWARGRITEDEALGVARRLARAELKRGRPNTRLTVPDALPESDAPRVSAIFRLDPRTMSFVKARAEAEGVTVTDVVRAALDQYAHGRPGTPTTFEPVYPHQ
jgi:hypothetical protein